MLELISHLHPLLVHLPIGFILMALIVEWFPFWRNRYKLNHAGTFFWFLSAGASILAVATGLALVNSGHYEGLNVFLHMWTGIGIGIVSTLIWLVRWKHFQWFPLQDTLLTTGLFILLMVAGHLGGEITHGEEFIKLPFKSSSAEQVAQFEEGDTILVYNDLILPVLEQKCMRCHETGDERGRLNLETREGLLSDIFGDPAVYPGNLEKSSIFKRVSLPTDHPKFMPPSGPLMTYFETRILEWWITSGASFDEDLRSLEVPEDIQQILGSQYGIQLGEKSLYETTAIEAATDEVLTEISSNSFNVNPIAANSPFVEVSRTGHGREITDEQVRSLLAIKDQLAWLDLADTNFSDEQAVHLQEFPNLIKLKLQNTSITDKAISYLTGATSLEVLNLYNTAVSDEGANDISKLSSLKLLYIWQTDISPEAVETLLSKNGELEIIGQNTLAPVN